MIITFVPRSLAVWRRTSLKCGSWVPITKRDRFWHRAIPSGVPDRRKAGVNQTRSAPVNPARSGTIMAIAALPADFPITVAEACLLLASILSTSTSTSPSSSARFLFSSSSTHTLPRYRNGAESYRMGSIMSGGCCYRMPERSAMGVGRRVSVVLVCTIARSRCPDMAGSIAEGAAGLLLRIRILDKLGARAA